MKLGRIWSFTPKGLVEIRIWNWHQTKIFQKISLCLGADSFLCRYPAERKIESGKKSATNFFNVRDALLIFVRHAHGHSTLCLWHYVRTDQALKKFNGFKRFSTCLLHSKLQQVCFVNSICFDNFICYDNFICLLSYLLHYLVCK